MSSSARRKLILACPIVALGAWYGISEWLIGARPAVAQGSAGDPRDELDAADVAAATTPGTSAALRLEQRAISDASWPPNPFVRAWETDADDHPVESAALTVAGRVYLLSAIISGSEPLAMIDGRVVTVGDRLAPDVTVVAIDELSVTLQGAEGQLVLALPE